MSVVPERYELAYRLDQPQQVLQQRDFLCSRRNGSGSKDRRLLHIQ